MYWEIPPKLLEIIEPIAAMRGLELVDAQVRSAPGQVRLCVIIDRADGGRVTVDECASMSRELGRSLEVAEVFSGAYLLEVTSPGVDRVLAREIDFERAVGQRVLVELREPVAGRRKLTGRLVAAADGELAIELAEERVSVPLPAVRRANAVYESPADASRERGKPRGGSGAGKAKKARRAPGASSPGPGMLYRPSAGILRPSAGALRTSVRPGPQPERCKGAAVDAGARGRRAAPVRARG
jgi:ribosome maturation factor RimP